MVRGAAPAEKPGNAAGPSVAGGHFGFLDGLRGVAALWVVLFHLTVSSTLPPVDDGGTGSPAGLLWNGLFGHGGLGVAVFFVLSGFVIAHSLRRGLVGVDEVGSFMVRRFIRLTPPYWAAIVVAVVVHLLAVVVNDEPFAPGGHPLSAGQVVTHLLYLESIAGQRYINPVFWTLMIEMQFYLALALFVWAAGRVARGRPELFRLAAGLVGLGVLVGSGAGDETQTTLVPLAYSFWLGAVVYWAWTGRLHRAEAGAYVAALGVVLAVRPDPFLAASLATGLLLALAAAVPGGLTSWLSSAPFRFLGRVSYSLYLVHVPVQGAALAAVVRVTGTGPAGVALAATVSTGASIVAAAIFWWLVERPSLAWAASRRRARPGPDGVSAQLVPESA